MNNFLRETKLLRKLSDSICIVLGNESCDLDSAVSCLSLAYYYDKNREQIPSKKPVTGVLPLFNINRKDYPLKTEVTYFLENNSIDKDNLTFRDDLSDSQLLNNTLILVDHHVSPYKNYVTAVFDHRPFDVTSNLNNDCEQNIQIVGSCATLIAEKILKNVESEGIYKQALELLYGAIVLDTVNFSKEADRAKELDYKILDDLERYLQIEKIQEHRKYIFEKLVNARSDISSLDSYQILFKDMKMLSNNSIKIALPGFPMLVENYINLKDSAENVKRFAKDENCSLVLLIGVQVSNGVVRRDFGLINVSDSQLFTVIIQNLLEYNNPNLELEEYYVNFLNGRFFQQNNVKASRKQILPIVNKVLNKLK